MQNTPTASCFLLPPPTPLPGPIRPAYLPTQMAPWCMIFGNGNGSAFSDLAGALDVPAHEMSHGVIENTANLIYENQPGALNESFADVFGVLFEFSVEGGNGDWLLGEDITTPKTAGSVLRNRENPAATNVAFNGQQPTKMSEFRNLPNTDENDHGGVHTNSGIP